MNTLHFVKFASISLFFQTRNEVAQSCPTLCDPMDYTVHGILQARVWEWEWVAFPFSRDLCDPGMEPGSPALQVDSLPAELPGKPKNCPESSMSFPIK